MKKVIVLFALLSMVFIGSFKTLAQEPRLFSPVKFVSRNLGGPRLGFTVIPGNSELTENLKEQNVGRVLSQFGWHFEYQIVPNIEGPCFIIEFIPLVAGVEYGKIIPSTTLGFGIRFPNGIEFGMGPNVMAQPKNVTSALMIAVGKSFDFGGVSIPLNLALTTNPKGYRVSFIFGYAIEKGS
jgi:hypothetical protein